MYLKFILPWEKLVRILHEWRWVFWTVLLLRGSASVRKDSSYWNETCVPFTVRVVWLQEHCALCVGTVCTVCKFTVCILRKLNIQFQNANSKVLRLAKLMFSKGHGTGMYLYQSRFPIWKYNISTTLLVFFGQLYRTSATIWAWLCVCGHAAYTCNPPPPPPPPPPPHVVSIFMKQTSKNPPQSTVWVGTTRSQC